MPSSTKSNAESKRAAKGIVDEILRTYPDFGKVQPYYVMGLVEVVESYPEHIQRAFADKRTGIVSRCKFLPTIADFVTMAGEILKAEDAKASEAARIADLAARVQARRMLPEPKIGLPPVQYFAPNGDKISASEAAERLERHNQNKAHVAMMARRKAYVLEIGQGDAERGELLMIERGLDAVPDDWTPAECAA